MSWSWPWARGPEGDEARAHGALEGRERRYLRYSGRVQAVGFRYAATMVAEAAGVTGWVRNRADGDVEAEVQGLPEQLDAFERGIEERSLSDETWIRAVLVAREFRAPVEEEGFSVRY